MGFADLWNRTLVYFGIAEEEDWDETTTSRTRSSSATTRERPERAPARPAPARAGVRRLDRPGAGGERAATAVAAATRRRRCRRPPPVRVHLVVPRSFNDAQQIADKFKESIPVILNLQSSDQDLSKRLIDFASGLTYALDGGMQRVADKVFLLTPRNVEVSRRGARAPARARRLLQPGLIAGTRRHVTPN